VARVTGGARSSNGAGAPREPTSRWPTPRRCGGRDVDFCRFRTTKVKVPAISANAFYAAPDHGRDLVRFAFCKRRETMGEAVRCRERGLA
jgi:N-succinyldiaminopimelate aminotransferase